MSSFVVLFFLLGCILLLQASKGLPDDSKNHNCHVLGRIGGVIYQSSRIGREQKIAMEMAIHDFEKRSLNCSKLVLHLKDLDLNSAGAVSAAVELVNQKHVDAIQGTLTLQEAAQLVEFVNVIKDVPIISITSKSSSTAPIPEKLLPFIQMTNHIDVQTQCIASIVGHFRWRKVITVYERSTSFTEDSGIITHLSDSLRGVDSFVEHHIAFPIASSLSNRGAYVKQELNKLKSKSVRIFIVMRSSLDFAVILFEKAKELGMMEKGYVWIVSDEIAGFLDSIPSPVILNMQGVIGFKNNYEDTSESFREFRTKFRRMYRSKYPEEEEYSNPSFYALRAYDATWIVAKALQNLQGKIDSKELVKQIFHSNFEGLSGRISFNDGFLTQNPIFQIVNVIGKSYREIAWWSPEYGFFEDQIENEEMKKGIFEGLEGKLTSIYWPGGERTVPKGWTLAGTEKPLRIGVPARGAFNQFVNVVFDQDRNETSIGGFSIDVFEAAVKQLPYHLPFAFVPYYGSYDEMVAEVHNKRLDAAVGDTEIMADRYVYAEFSQPYIESGLVMVVTVKPGLKDKGFVVVDAFKKEMWIQMAAMSMSSAVAIWLTEYANNNPDIRGSFWQLISSMLWFCVTVLSLAHRETIRSNLSRLVLVAWLCVVAAVAACFTAVLSSMLTVPKLQPSILDVDYLLRINAPVGCNGNSFIVRYLINVLHFKPENIRKINSINHYPSAFDKGEILAAFFVAPHAKVFLAKYCKGYIMTGPTYKLGGFGFVFSKGSPLAIDISEAILKITQNGEVNQLEKHMLSFSNCSTLLTQVADNVGSLGPEPVSGLFKISGSISTIAIVIAVARLMRRQWSIHDLVQRLLTMKRVWRWAALILTECYSGFGLRFFRETTIMGQNHQTDAAQDRMGQKEISLELTTTQTYI
ncbi:glutamate receptor 2.9-like isoform X1 [Olea europaea var. sylvestris]|uniref:glutamate receptor 2.9-like isoform X1 n=1 Tax=Olea europaea var. sylvestris TaxID=158386 RepID=UPI000C1D59F6|nr:glutamate receptor 2.9-like isoform X1 [Olea europaea var. sylvestris]